MSSGRDFFAPLSDEINESFKRNGPSLTFDQFINWVHPRESSEDKPGIMRSTMNLEKRCKKKMYRFDTHKKKKLSYQYRKNLGLYKIEKTELFYTQLLPLNDLWKDYMRKLLNTNELEVSNWNNRTDHPMFEQLSFKLYRADFHGALISIIKSLCPTLVGCSGIVAIETKSCFKIVGKDNACRTVPKICCQFELELDTFKFQFFGNNFITRPAERTSKKLKQVRPPSLNAVR